MDHEEKKYTDTAPEKRRTFFRRLFSPWLLLLLILAGAAFLFVYGEEPEEVEEVRREQRQVFVDLASASEITLLETVRGVGSLQPVQMVQIKPEESGRIRAVHFQEGGFVTQNQLLFELDDQKLLRRLASQEAAVEETRIRLENLRRNYERFAELYRKELISEDEYERVKTDLESTQAQVRRLRSDVELIQEELKDAIIRAPFDGFISERLADPGAFVAQGETLTIIYQTDPMEISFYVPERHFARVALGQQVMVSISAFPDQVFTGQVRYISPFIDESTRRFKVRASIDNPDHKLKPGFFAQTTLILAVKDDALVVPEQSLVSIRDGYLAYIVDMEENKAVSRRIEIGMRRPGIVEIVSGLNKGDLVVKAGHMQLVDGSSVSIVETLEHDWAEAWDEAAFLSGSDKAVMHSDLGRRQ